MSLKEEIKTKRT